MDGIVLVKSLLTAVLIVAECLSLGMTKPSDTPVLVETKYGKILGKTQHFPEESGLIKTINTFLGIPFAAPPVNSLRFRPPKPPAAWKPRVHNATFFRNVCQQTEYSYFENSFRIAWPGFTWKKDSSEDCLYLNIFAPGKNASTNRSELYPVIMFIHGGSYVFGGTARHTTPGQVLPRWGVVLVTVAYRLGPFGFLSSGDAAARGNWGLLDQVQALKWIQENIKAFGGNPNNVTILGVSSGGASIGLHLMSPLTKGLFHQAISESGVEFSPFAFNSVEKAVLKTKNTANKLGCDTEDSNAMIECLRKKDARSIINNYEWESTAPVIDNYFIYDTPENLRRSGKFYRVPLISGFNTNEGAHNTESKFRPPTEMTLSVFRQAIKTFVNKYSLHGNKNIADLIEDALEFQYTPWNKTPDSPTLLQKIIDMQSDYFVAAPTVEVLGVQSMFAPAYMYEFSHRSKVNTEDAWRGVQHGDNTPYDFGAPFLNITSLNFTDEDRNVSRLIMSLYANFAKYGNPTPQSVQGVTWNQFNRTNRFYLRIQAKPEMKVNFEPRRMAFWNSYYPKLLNFSKRIDKGSGTNPGNHNKGLERVSNPVLVGFLLTSVLSLHLFQFD